MTPTASPRAVAFAAIGITGLLGGMALGRPELVAIAAPFVVMLGLGLGGAGTVEVDAGLEADDPRAIEGTPLDVQLRVRTSRAFRRLQVTLDLPRGVGLTGALSSKGHPLPTTAAGSVVLRTRPGAWEETRLTLETDRWGSYRIGHLELFAQDRWGIVSHHLRQPCETTFKVFPTPATMRLLFRPSSTRLRSGDLLSRSRGPGLEFAELRPHRSGDDWRRINWRVAARGRGLWVNERHPERNSDVILFVDSLVESHRGVEAVLDLVVRAAVALTSAHLRRHDRVGVVTFGEPVRWLVPGSGQTQHYRILDMLMESRHGYQTVWRGVQELPRRALPAGALVIALTPLLDDRVIHALADLRGRGFDVAIVEVPPEHFTDATTDHIERLARRIWMLQRDTVRSAFRRQGVALAAWSPDQPFEVALAEIEGFRRQIRRAHT